VRIAKADSCPFEGCRIASLEENGVAFLDLQFTHTGLRDRALLGVLAYTFARIGAVVNLKVQ
jgi:hypothetical protein